TSETTTETTSETTTETTTDGEGTAFVVRVKAGDCTRAPAEGVRVIMDTPDGQRVEAMTDASGEVTFEGLDFAEGTASVTASKAGHELLSYVGLTAERSPLEIPLWTPSGKVNLVGNASDMVDTSHVLLVSSSLCSREPRASQKSGVGYSIWVTPGEAFKLFATEFSWEATPSGQGGIQTFYQWLWEDHEALTDNGIAGLTFAGGITPESESGSFSLDALSDDSPVAGDRGTGYIIVRGGGNLNSVSVGFPTEIDINGDATAFDYTVEHLPASMLADPITQYSLRETEPTSAVMLRVYEPGMPRAGDFTPEFIDVPAVTPPAGDGGVYPLAGQTWTIGEYDDGVIPSLVVIVPETRFYWSVYGPANATSITPPTLPDGVEHLDVLQASETVAIVVLERGGDGLLAGYVDAVTNTDAFAVRYE
ncbi:MAG: carboxypeptidase regulatory-like domain-containing protein, partial [Myxococcales bacterium]|nr:carboxypeptidase regulatory-like domain-containing protein [Myxococcales bacterium]